MPQVAGHVPDGVKYFLYPEQRRGMLFVSPCVFSVVLLLLLLLLQLLKCFCLVFFVWLHSDLFALLVIATFEEAVSTYVNTVLNRHLFSAHFSLLLF